MAKFECMRSVSLTAEQDRLLCLQAQKEGRKVSNLIRRSLCVYLQEQGLMPEVQDINSPEDE